MFWKHNEIVFGVVHSVIYNLMFVVYFFKRKLCG